MRYESPSQQEMLAIIENGELVAAVLIITDKALEIIAECKMEIQPATPDEAQEYKPLHFGRSLSILEIRKPNKEPVRQPVIVYR